MHILTKDKVSYLSQKVTIIFSVKKYLIKIIMSNEIGSGIFYNLINCIGQEKRCCVLRGMILENLLGYRIVGL